MRFVLRCLLLQAHGPWEMICTSSRQATYLLLFIYLISRPLSGASFFQPFPFPSAQPFFSAILYNNVPRQVIFRAPHDHLSPDLAD
ncbi:hypothetical protein B0J18DRAFT_66797 [Chaetomium sp. MPI-SDFR-AT-0129]|nr:hypothetical protein B0J18DRAFT_66797 [Chaetomium sp. MPI-SDFR-AT-0129]